MPNPFANRDHLSWVVTSPQMARCHLENGFYGEKTLAGFGVPVFTCLDTATACAEAGGWDGDLELPVMLEVEFQHRALQPVTPEPWWPQQHYWRKTRFWQMHENDLDANWWPCMEWLPITSHYVDDRMTIDIDKLREVSCPVQNPPWGVVDGAVTPKMVLECFDKGELESVAIDAGYGMSARTHAARIAWLMTNGWDDHIHIDLGVPGLYPDGHWAIGDGNHRLYAAILLGHASIEAHVVASKDLAKQFAYEPEFGLAM